MNSYNRQKILENTKLYALKAYSICQYAIQYVFKYIQEKYYSLRKKYYYQSISQTDEETSLFAHTYYQYNSTQTEEEQEHVPKAYYYKELKPVNESSIAFESCHTTSDLQEDTEDSEASGDLFFTCDEI